MKNDTALLLLDYIVALYFALAASISIDLNAPIYVTISFLCAMGFCLINFMDDSRRSQASRLII